MPSNSQALVALARVARRQNRWKDSLRLFEEAAKLNPRDISLLKDRAMTFLMLRQPAAAHEMIDRALAINPDDFELLVLKARLFQWESNLPAAKSVLDKLASTPQTDDVVAVQVDHLVLSRSPEEAETLLLGTLAKSGSRTDLEQAYLRESLGRVQSLAGQPEKAQQTYLEAKSELEAVQREQPTSPWVAGLVGSVEAGLGNKEAALREGQRGVSLWPASEDPVYGPGAEENLAGIEALVDEAAPGAGADRTPGNDAIWIISTQSGSPSPGPDMGPLAIASALQSDCGRSRAKNDLPLTPVRSAAIRASKKSSLVSAEKTVKLNHAVLRKGATLDIR